MPVLEPAVNPGLQWVKTIAGEYGQSISDTEASALSAKSERELRDYFEGMRRAETLINRLF